MKLVSVNVSLTQQVHYKDKTVSTGIFKQPVAGTITVEQFQLVGDQQADLVNHGGEHKALYGFSANHYAFWQQSLAIDQLDYGRFGENLTIEGLNESDICIGDQLQIGTAILEVTQPRVPCFKLGMTFNDDSMPRKFVEHGETGIYFRVIQTGALTAGDSVEIISRDPTGLTVKQLFKAYFDKNMAANQSYTVMETAAKIPALSAEWLEKVESRLAQLNSASGSIPK